MWLSLVERCVRDAEAASSNLVISTIQKRKCHMVLSFLFCLDKIRTSRKDKAWRKVSCGHFLALCPRACPRREQTLGLRRILSSRPTKNESTARCFLFCFFGGLRIQSTMYSFQPFIYSILHIYTHIMT